MFEAMQAKYPNLKLPIPQGVMSGSTGTQRSTRSLSRHVNASAAAAEEREEGAEGKATVAQETEAAQHLPSEPVRKPMPASKKRRSASKKSKSVAPKEEETTVQSENGDKEEDGIVSIELTHEISCRLSDLVKVFPPHDRTYQHDPLMPIMRPLRTIIIIPAPCVMWT
jgi:hypothetical protein